MGARARSADARGDTIAAVATAAGRAALAIVRLSGPAAREVAARVCTPWPIAPRAATRVRLRAPHGGTSHDDAAHAGASADAALIDDALATNFPAPRSATGEDVVEFTVHGGPFVSTALMAALVAAGARPALAGEFTERAVRNGKLDLLQAEAVADLIDARSRAMHRTALRQLSGSLSHRFAELRRALIDVDALIAYDIDFPGEDDGPQPRTRALEASARVVDALDALMDTLPAAELGRDGVTVVLAGAPNAGKSSLFNALAGERRAIVSEVPGTTRDAIEVLVDHDPWPLRLVDTAGLRASDDVVERLGVEVSMQRLSGAHVVLVCGDDDASLRAATAAVEELGVPAQALIQVRTKSDLLADGAAPGAVASHAIAVSATTGAGLAALREAITNAARTAVPEPPESSPIVTRARHVAALRTARGEVDAFRAAWERDDLPAPVAATHLRAAVHALDELLGAIDVDEVLERVFRSFCIGK